MSRRIYCGGSPSVTGVRVPAVASPSASRVAERSTRSIVKPSVALKSSVSRSVMGAHRSGASPFATVGTFRCSVWTEAPSSVSTVIRAERIA